MIWKMIIMDFSIMVFHFLVLLFLIIKMAVWNLGGHT